MAKTDAVDAKRLAALGQALDPRLQGPADPARERRAFLHGRRAELVLRRQQERTRLKGCEEPVVVESLKRMIQGLDREILAFDQAISALIAQSEALETARRLLASIPGIGPVTAAALLALMPELGARPGKARAALAGLAPLNRDSGQMRGQRTLPRVRPKAGPRINSGGRKRVRDALYRAAVCASRSKSRFAQTYRRLTDAAKPAKLADAPSPESSSSPQTPSSGTRPPSPHKHSCRPLQRRRRAQGGSRQPARNGASRGAGRLDAAEHGGATHV